MSKRKPRMTRKQKKENNPHWKGKSNYALKQQRKRERAAKEAGLPIDETWAEINEARR